MLITPCIKAVREFRLIRVQGYQPKNKYSPSGIVLSDIPANDQVLSLFCWFQPLLTIVFNTFGIESCLICFAAFHRVSRQCKRQRVWPVPPNRCYFGSHEHSYIVIVGFVVTYIIVVSLARNWWCEAKSRTLYSTKDILSSGRILNAYHTE